MFETVVLIANGANQGLAVKAAFFREAGLEVSICGTETGL